MIYWTAMYHTAARVAYLKFLLVSSPLYIESCFFFASIALIIHLCRKHLALQDLIRGGITEMHRQEGETEWKSC